MLDVESLFELLTAAHRKGVFWQAFNASSLATAPVRLHPLGFRVAKVDDGRRLSLRLHIWPDATQDCQSGYDIHDHVFDLTSHVLVGELRQTTYRISDSSPATHAVYGVGYDVDGSFLKRTQAIVKAVPEEMSTLFAGSTYGLRATEFHRLERISTSGAATLVLTRSGDGSPQTLGPLNGMDSLRFRRETLPHGASQELAPIIAATSEKTAVGRLKPC